MCINWLSVIPAVYPIYFVIEQSLRYLAQKYVYRNFKIITCRDTDHHVLSFIGVGAP